MAGVVLARPTACWTRPNSCPDEIAWRMGFIDDAWLERVIDRFGNGDYPRYLRRLLARGR